MTFTFGSPSSPWRGIPPSYSDRFFRLFCFFIFLSFFFLFFFSLPFFSLPPFFFSFFFFFFFLFFFFFFFLLFFSSFFFFFCFFSFFLPASFFHFSPPSFLAIAVCFSSPLLGRSFLIATWLCTVVRLGSPPLAFPSLLFRPEDVKHSFAATALQYSGSPRIPEKNFFNYTDSYCIPNLSFFLIRPCEQSSISSFLAQTTQETGAGAPELVVEHVFCQLGSSPLSRCPLFLLFSSSTAPLCPLGGRAIDQHPALSFCRSLS